MVKISPSESALTGKWVFDGKKVVADEITEKIDLLVKSHLKWLACDESMWNNLYEDPADKRLWELTYPQSEMHGGGPPRLQCLSLEEAKEKYNLNK